MIEEISIQNLGVISAAQINFQQGMNALTGETGAGKTMALTSLMLLMGAKAAAAKVRHGEDRATVTGVFSVPADSPAVKIVETAGGKIDTDDSRAEIIVSRQVLASGRSRAFLGGVNVPVSALREIAAELFTVHGQQDQIRLVSKSEHRQALDEFANLQKTQAFHEYYAKWIEYRELSNKLETERENAAAIGTERLALEALVKRVESVAPQPGEDDELRAQAVRLDNVEVLREALARSVQLLEGDEYQPGALSMIDTAERELVQSHDKDLAKYAQTLGDGAALISDVLNNLASTLQNLDADPARLAAIHERRAELTALTRELGMDIPTILARHEAAQTRLQEIANPEKYLAELTQKLQRTEAKLKIYAAKLTAVRRKAAKQLSESVTSELQNLAMKGAKFAVKLDPLPAPGKDGIDDIEFLLAPHSGAVLSKLNATASGGEMSRIMLAIEVTLAAKNAKLQHTFIFDEVDAGIGGETALSVGRRLGKLAESAQVIVVTHLAQVAAAAGTHHLVEKESGKDAAKTTVRTLKPAEREIELARMLSGQADSAAARAHAAELINAISVAPLESGV
ncbi:DNA repair protein RecN [Arcanobacterium hippocoleae]